jgi:CelD/BcsL family acetyltransferase involved in cellulose biosynthesis
LKLEVINSLQDFYSLKNLWSELLIESGSKNVHLQFEWMYNWYITFGKNSELLILLVKEDDKIIGIAPLVRNKKKIKKIFNIKQIVFLGNGILDWGDFIIAESKEEVLKLFLQKIDFYNSGEVVLHNIQDDSPNLSSIQDIIKQKRFILKKHSKCFYIDSLNQSWDDFYKTTSFKFVRKDMRRIYNHINEFSWNVTETEFESVDEDMKKMERLYNLSQIRKGRYSHFTNASYINFLKNIINEFKLKDEVRVFYLNLEGKPIAYYLCFIYKNAIYFYNTGFDSTYDKLSPAKILMNEIIKKSFEQGYSEINFMRGASEYKTKWTETFRTNYQIKWFCEKGFYGFLNKFRRSNK